MFNKMLKCQSAIVMRTGFQGNHGDRNGGHLIGYGGLISEKANVPVPVATLYGQERNLLQ